MLDFTNDVQTILDARETAESTGLRYVCDDAPGIRRKRAGKGFAYLLPGGARLAEIGVRLRQHFQLRGQRTLKLAPVLNSAAGPNRRQILMGFKKTMDLRQRRERLL